MENPPDKETGLDSLRVIFFESRLAHETGQLVSKKGGIPFSAPALREIPLQENEEALAFGKRLFEGGVDVLILLTGVGTRILLKTLETRFPPDQILEALSKIELVARGPKPVKVLAENGLVPAVTVPEPNTWKDLLRMLDERLPVSGKNVTVQEYGISNPELLEGLSGRGARVSRVPVYQWGLPEDITPLREAIRRIIAGEADVMLFTNATQVRHLMEVANEQGLGAQVITASERLVVGSVGPMASEAIRALGFPVDIEPEHPKLGALVQLAAREAKRLLVKKPTT